MFSTTVFNYDTILTRIRQQAYLTKGITLTVVNEYANTRYRFFFEGGIQSYIHYLNRTAEPIGEDVFYADKQQDDTQVEIALQYKKDDFSEKIISFVNKCDHSRRRNACGWIPDGTHPNYQQVRS